jgi:hypothetical protein
MTAGTVCEMRRYQRISLPEGMFVAWYGGGEQQVSRVKTLGMGGLFLLRVQLHCRWVRS